MIHDKTPLSFLEVASTATAVRSYSTVPKWPEWTCGRCGTFLVPIAIRFTEDGRSLLIDRGVDYQKIKDCGGNAAFIRYFCLVWRIELSALMGKGSADLSRWAGDRRDR
ncbi:hypothetical protein K6W16_15960 [Burkholderia dolosa]|uniref:Uncharacterized protein n=1 Tax=Burkholderia dolosa TaxID=152500 RepID=A0A892HUH6_9BURK|nr:MULTISPECIES: hypothetical protein [Burkholderia]MBR8417470.1 hypothetical protein [Burkholderia dolosa]MBY4657484.1 hypothetical protein [Burkholderia dolosa]MBY4688534.1 hypothetical protein [Burkholderia dolosa]MBY4782622.1 hypothetical protein [Burkholderia dolosa]MBY4786832.1 hypothetical protein [Burkholderia dolosa]